MDHFFQWHDLPDPQRVGFAKMKLVGQAKLHWGNVKRRRERSREGPVLFWIEMKELLREKYVPLSYKQRLLDQWHTLRQGSMTVTEYIAKFDEYMMRCDVDEDPAVVLSRFRMGLKFDLQRELMPHMVTSLEHAYQMVQELEHYVRQSPARGFEIRPTVPRVAPQGARPQIGNQPRAQPGTQPVNRNRGNNVAGPSTRTAMPGQCYRCGGMGHIAAEFSNRGGRIAFVSEHSTEEEVAYEVEGDQNDEEITVQSLRAG